MQTSRELVIQSKPLPGASGETLAMTPEAVGFDFLTFRVRKLERGEQYTSGTDNHELGIVLLGGHLSVQSSAGYWSHIGGRAQVFGGLPYALYLPVETRFTLTAETACEVAFCFCKAEKPFPARLITPDEVEVEIRGGGNATRQINHILKPEFPAQRLLVVEVYTPSGNWSSYPPHKHDRDRPPIEADLEEVYYFRFRHPDGYGFHRVYTADGRHDDTMTVRDGDLVVVREGYHPFVTAYGHDAYYLNVLAGTRRSMAASDDPRYAAFRQSWPAPDPRLPVIARPPSQH